MSSPPFQWHGNPLEEAEVNSGCIVFATLKTCIYRIIVEARDSHAHSAPFLGALFGQAVRMIRQILLLLVVFASPLYSDDPRWEIRHTFLGLGNRALGSIIAEDGPFSWNIDLPTNEGIPINQTNCVKLTEGTRQKKVVWPYSGGNTSSTTFRFSPPMELSLIHI